MRIFVLRDILADAFLTPFMSRTNGTAMRELQAGLRNRDPENIVATNPKDFQLYVIGDFEMATGVLQSLDAPVLLGSVADLVAEV